MAYDSQKVNFIRHFINVHEHFLKDERLTPFHISLYNSLFLSWNNFGFCSPLSISRSEQMNQSKIGSVNTYLKCLKELDSWGYIKYIPSHNPQKGSSIYLFTFDTSTDTTANTSSDTTDEQRVIPLINYTKLKETIKTNKTIDVEAKNKNNKNLLFPKNEVVNSKKNLHSFPKSLIEVKILFLEKKFPSTEAEKFYNYFESNGWLVGGRAKMKNWKAAANNWMLNSNKFNAQNSNEPKPNNLHVNQDKDYSIPL